MLDPNDNADRETDIFAENTEISFEKPFRQISPGMGQAVFERTVGRRKADGSWETWGDVAERVALGNSLLCTTAEEQAEEYTAMRKHLRNATMLMSGRHLQHGDENQPTRNAEVFLNCATSATSFISFYLLLNGAGVGRSFDDDMLLTNFDYAPTLLCVLDEKHPDFSYTIHESKRDAEHKYGSGRDVLWHTVGDSREGWAKALEIFENSAFERIHSNKMLILDFSKVRPKGSPIGGMQNRPASGPAPLMGAFAKAATLKNSGMAKFKQAMYIDHYFAEVVLVGGSRRSARMATKIWWDATIFDFITLKRPLEFIGKSVEEIASLRKTASFSSFLWSSNNSVMVDKEFWTLIRNNDTSDRGQHARKVFDLLTAAAYGDGTGEPGIINSDRLAQSDTGWNDLNRGDYVGSKKYQVEDDTQILLSKLAKKAKKKKYHHIVNPCVTGDTYVMTTQGSKMVCELLDKPFSAVVNGKEYEATAFWSSGIKPVFEVTTIHPNGTHRRVKATGNHEVLVQNNTTSTVWREVKDLKPGDKMVLADGFEPIDVLSIEPAGIAEVFDCSVSIVHCFDGNGLVLHNCGEISINLLGAYCCLADVVPFHAETIDEAEEAFRVSARALVRTNTMDSLYAKEVKRTNRIGVGMTGVHEFAWKFFQVGFRDLINPDFDTYHTHDWALASNIKDAPQGVRAAAFWLTLSRFSAAVKDEGSSYSLKLGMNVPHTMTTIKPSGSVSKLFLLTEGWHLPSHKEFLRWVQFGTDGPLVAQYAKSGYPTRELKTYSGTTIVGFPTAPKITTLGMDDALVTAPEATPEEQFEWLRLGEKYWLHGGDDNATYGNQISYTLKYFPDQIDYEAFKVMLLENQSTVKCCSIMPATDSSSFEYQPEQGVTKGEYDSILRQINKSIDEDVGLEHVACESGACPINFNTDQKA